MSWRVRCLIGIGVLLLVGWLAPRATVGASVPCGGNHCLFLPTVEEAPPDTTYLPAAWLARLNRYRRAAGLEPVVEDPTLTRGVQQHVAYMLLNPDEYEHGETPGNPGYTPEGEQAARESNLWRTGPGFTEAEAIDGWMESLFHRFGMLRPDLTTTGFALACNAHGCAAALNVLGGTDGASAPDGTLYPAHTQRGVETSFLSWQFHPFEPPITLTAASLRTVTGEALPITTASADGFWNVATLRPDAPLTPGATYIAHMELRQEARTLARTWSFRMKGESLVSRERIGGR